MIRISFHGEILVGTIKKSLLTVEQPDFLLSQPQKDIKADILNVKMFSELLYFHIIIDTANNPPSDKTFQLMGLSVIYCDTYEISIFLRL